MRFSLRFIIIIAIALELALLGCVSASEPVRQVVVVSTNLQVAPIVQRCEMLSYTAWSCTLTSSQIDDLGGYADTLVLDQTTYLPSISR